MRVCSPRSSHARASTRSTPMPAVPRARRSAAADPHRRLRRRERACRLSFSRERITHVIDATHPFAAEMSRHAVEACAQTGTPLIALERAPWTRARRQLDRGRRRHRRGRCAARDRRRASSSPSAGSTSRRSRRSRSTSTLLRFVDPPEATTALRCGRDRVARAIHARRRSRADARRAASHGSSPAMPAATAHAPRSTRRACSACPSS